MLNRLFALLVSFVFVSALAAQNANERPVWDVKLEANKIVPSTLTVQNRCRRRHTFDIQPENVPFLKISKKSVKVRGGRDSVVPVKFNTNNMQPNTYNGRVLVICRSCGKEPTCTQDREILPVVLRIPGVANANAIDANDQKKKDPCKEKCEDLLNAANAKVDAAKTAQDAADAEKQKAKIAEDAAVSAEKNARNAEELATEKPRSDHAIINGEKFTTADTEYRRMLQAQINADHKAGKISNEEHERRTKANTNRKAREERLKNLARLKKEAAKARAAANASRKKANEAKGKADTAQKAADAARKVAEGARRAYEDCLKKAKEECDKLKALEAKRLAEAKAAEDAKLAAEQAKAAEEKARENRIRERKRLIALIKKLGLVSETAAKVPGIWDWLPDIMEVPVGTLAEHVAAVPVPTDSLKAVGGLYGLIGQMLNPCNDAAGKRTLLFKLNDLGYSDADALTELERLCNFMKEAKAKLEAVAKSQQN